MIKIIALYLCIMFYGFSGWAAPLLTVDTTFRRENMEIDLREANSVLSGSSLDKANEIFSFFEQKIFPVVPDSFRSQLAKRSIKILFQKNLSKAAIFSGKVDAAQALTIEVRATLVEDPSFFRILSHEWFHALHFAVHPDEPTWVREGLAQVFERMIFGTYNGPNLISGLENSTTALEHEFNINELEQEAYGHVFLYFYYLYQKCGKENVFWKLVESQPGKFGEQNIENVLPQVSAKSGVCANFRTSVISAEIARFHNRKTKDAGNSSDDYLIIPELNRPIKNVLSAKDVPLIVPGMKKFEPKIFQAAASKALKKYLLHSDEWVFFTLGQSTPYSVKPGFEINASASPPDLIFLMKIL